VDWRFEVLQLHLDVLLPGLQTCFRPFYQDISVSLA